MTKKCCWTVFCVFEVLTAESYAALKVFFSYTQKITILKEFSLKISDIKGSPKLSSIKDIKRKLEK